MSSQAIPDDDDEDDFDLPRSQPGFPMAKKKKRNSSRTQVSSCHGSTKRKVNTGTPSASTKKPGSSSARRIIFSDSDSDFDMEKYVFSLTDFGICCFRARSVEWLGVLPELRILTVPFK